MTAVLTAIAFTVTMLVPFVLYLCWNMFYDCSAYRHGYDSDKHRRNIRVYNTIMGLSFCSWFVFFTHAIWN